MTANVVDERRYARLLASAVPAVIDDERELRRQTARLEALLERGDARSPEEIALTRLLVLLVEDFESRNYRLRASSVADRIRVLMEDRGLRQVDLLPEFGSRSAASDILSGRRRVSRLVAGRLARRFSLPVDLFLD